MKNLEEQLQELVAGKLGVEKNEIVSKARFREDLGASRLDLVRIVQRTEELLKVNIRDCEWNTEDSFTFGMFVEVVKGKL